MGEDAEKLNDLFTYLDQDEAGPSRLRRGRRKDINLFPGIRDCSNDPDSEDKNNMNLDNNAENFHIIDHVDDRIL